MLAGLWVWTLTIPDWRPDARLSINGRRRSSPWTIRALQDAAKERAIWAIREELGNHPRRGYYRGQVEVHIRFAYRIRRRRDPDGLAGMAKPILDALVDEGLIIDDDSDHIRLVISAEVGGSDYTRIDLAGIK